MLVAMNADCRRRAVLLDAAIATLTLDTHRSSGLIQADQFQAQAHVITGEACRCAQYQADGMDELVPCLPCRVAVALRAAYVGGASSLPNSWSVHVDRRVE